MRTDELIVSKNIWPETCPETYKFPLKVPSPVMILAQMTFPFVSRIFEAMMTFAGGHGCAGGGIYPPLAMESHIY